MVLLLIMLTKKLRFFVSQKLAFYGCEWNFFVPPSFFLAYSVTKPFIKMSIFFLKMSKNVQKCPKSYAVSFKMRFFRMWPSWSQMDFLQKTSCIFEKWTFLKCPKWKNFITFITIFLRILFRIFVIYLYTPPYGYIFVICEATLARPMTEPDIHAIPFRQHDRGRFSPGDRRSPSKVTIYIITCYIMNP